MNSKLLGVGIVIIKTCECYYRKKLQLKNVNKLCWSIDFINYRGNYFYTIVLDKKKYNENFHARMKKGIKFW